MLTTRDVSGSEVAGKLECVYLTLNEIQDLFEMQIDNLSKRKIRHIFILNCFIGLRHSDWDKDSFENIDENELYIKIQKTKEPDIIPVKPLVMEIFGK